MEVFKERVEEYALSNEEISNLTPEQSAEYKKGLERIKSLEHDYFVLENSVRIAKKINTDFDGSLNRNRSHEKIVDFFKVGMIVMSIIVTFIFFGCKA